MHLAMLAITLCARVVDARTPSIGVDGGVRHQALLPASCNGMSR